MQRVLHPPGSDGVSALRVADEGFLVASLIERCPRTMMLRELVRNAIEAALTAPRGQRRVEIGETRIEGVRKLRIWNTGRGMSAGELHRMCDIASSIGKPHGLDGNFGMGAKVAALPSNQHGLRYRSCREGMVHEVRLGKRGTVYGRLRIDGRDITDVTRAAENEGRDLAFDWTEVVLFGNRAEQDTVCDPYDGNPGVSEDWVRSGLAARFLDLPDGVTITVPDGTRFVPLAPSWTGARRHDAVATADGPVLHYLHDPERITGFGCAIAYRSEIYDVRTPRDWVQWAPRFGLPFGAGQVSVMVELSAAFQVRPDGYRQFLRYRDAAQLHVETVHFARLVAEHRPDWLLALIDSLAPDARHVMSVQGELATLLHSLGVRRTRGGVAMMMADESGAAGETGPEVFEAEPPPEIVPLRDEADIEARGLSGRGGQYMPESHQLFVNLLHGAVPSMAQALAAEHATHPEIEQVREIAQTLAEEALVRRIGRALVHAMAWRGAGVFHGWEIDQASSVPSLSLAASDWAGSVAVARAELSRRLTATTQPAAHPQARRALPLLLALRTHRAQAGR
jgi:hypothetical protein